GGFAMRPTGEHSVIPHACTGSIPSSARLDSNVSDAAEPPITRRRTDFSAVRSTSPASTAARRLAHTVGTAAENVTRPAAKHSARPVGTERRPGNDRPARASRLAYGRFQ